MHFNRTVINLEAKQSHDIGIQESVARDFNYMCQISVSVIKMLAIQTDGREKRETDCTRLGLHIILFVLN